MLHGEQIPAWVVMWGLAAAMYGVAKGATVLVGRVRGVSVGRMAGYLLLFPGMNAARFCGPHARMTPVAEPPRGLRYGMNIVAGAILLWLGARVATQHLLVEAWVGMIGVMLMLHFGLLQLLLLAWRRAGFDAPPLMREPVRAASVGEFWGLRWNTAFRQLSHQFLFMPLARRVGPRVGMVVTFLVSGMVHDLVISLPAGGGWGLPTVYFVGQAMGVAVERSALGRRWLRGVVGRIWTIAVVAMPAPILFHEAFVLRVMVPFLVAIGALPKGASL